MAGVKMSSLTILGLVLYFGLFVSATDPVPVLLWQSYGGSSLSAPSSALRSLSGAEFADILLKKITDSKPLVLVFAEKALSVEDFTWIGSEAERPFTKLEKVYSSAKSKLYIPDVNGPMTALLNLNQHDYKLENAEMSDEIAPGSKRMVVVNLDSEKPGESRLDMLKRHDSYMSSVYNQLASKASSRKILAVYTGRNFAWTNGDSEDESSSRSRVRRAAEGTEEASNATFLSAPGVYLYSPSTMEIQRSGGDKKTLNLTNVIGTPTGDSRKNGDSKLLAKYDLGGDEGTAQIQFKFRTADGMWNLTEVTMMVRDEEDTLIPSSKIEAPLGFSYHCSTIETFVGKTFTLRVLNPQIQPYASNNTFGPTADCVYFFTPSILSGLLLSVLLLAITSWGIAMIMGIHTMDRFDDPKGKPLFIGSTE